MCDGYVPGGLDRAFGRENGWMPRYSLGNVSSQATIASSNSAEWLPTGTIYPQIKGKVAWHLWASGTEPGMNTNYQGQCLTR
jgi:hypothetical protein